MNEPRGPHQPSQDERAAEAAREAAIEAAREELVEGVIETARAIAEELSAQEGAIDPVAQIIAREVQPLADRLNPHQQEVLAALLRLHFSLKGPQTQLETTGHFNRPTFPAPPRDLRR